MIPADAFGRDAWTSQAAAPERPALPAPRTPVADPTCLFPKLSVRIPDELHVRVKVAAAQRHLTGQALVIAALEDWLARHGR